MHILRKYAKKTLKQLTSNNYSPLNRIELDRKRMLYNLELVQKNHPGFEVMPVLKGNAYGHGITQVAEILDSSKAKFLAVDGYFEAAKVRDITSKKILVMGYTLPENVHLLDSKRCSFVVQDINGLRAFGALGKPVRIHLELNTGMNRLGLQPEELSVYLKVLKKHPMLSLEGVMTHLADADNERDDSFTSQQVTEFDKQVSGILSDGFLPEYIHIAQTAGSVKVGSLYANAIRMGIGTYGINPLQQGDPYFAELKKLKPVLELKSTIIKTFDLRKGAPISYNCTFRAPAAMRVGVLPIGYYEGVPRELSNKGCVTYGNLELPILGRVCMNHTIIDLLDSGLQVKNEVTVISNNSLRPNSVAGLQAKHDIFNYALLTGLSSSVRRVIV